MTTANSAQQAPEVPRLCKVHLLVGDDTLIDYVLPAGVALIAVIEDLIPRVNAILKDRGRAPLDDTLTFQLCRADATPLDPQRSLDDSRVYDGDLLCLLPTDATERFAPVIEEVSTALARSARQQFATVDVTVARRVAGAFRSAGRVGRGDVGAVVVATARLAARGGVVGISRRFLGVGEGGDAGTR